MRGRNKIKEKIRILLFNCLSPSTINDDYQCAYTQSRLHAGKYYCIKRNAYKFIHQKFIDKHHYWEV